MTEHHAASTLPDEVRVRLYDQALTAAGIGAWECELETERLSWTRGVYDIFGYPESNPLRRADIVDLYIDESRRHMELARAEVIRSGAPVTLDTEIRTWQGEKRWMRLSINAVREGGRPLRIFGCKQDVTSDRQAIESLRQQAETDPLTGLANRSIFQAYYRDIINDNLNHGRRRMPVRGRSAFTARFSQCRAGRPARRRRIRDHPARADRPRADRTRAAKDRHDAEPPAVLERSSPRGRRLDRSCPDRPPAPPADRRTVRRSRHRAL